MRRSIGVSFVAGALLAGVILFWDAAQASTHTVKYPKTIPQVLWCRGCTPTSASMAMGYWDNYAPGQPFYLGSGKLTDYWRNLSAYSNGTGKIVSVPNTLEELRLAMGTDGSGVTWTSRVSPAIRRVTNTINGYRYGSRYYTGSAANSYCFSLVKSETSHNRPFIWSVGSTGIGHSLCGWGYTDTKYVITYNTWNYGRDDWYYRKYDNGAATTWQYLNTVDPGGWYGDNMIVIYTMKNWYAAGTIATIYWWQTGTRITNVTLRYSTTGGRTWTTFKSGLRSRPGRWMSYRWKVPNRLTSTARVRVIGLRGTSYIAGDGVKRDFRIVSASSPAAAPATLCTLAVESTPTSAVPISGTSPGTTCYSAQVERNSKVSLSAPATFVDGDKAYKFARWTLDGAPRADGETTLNFTVGSDSTAVAVYQDEQP